MNRQIVKLTPGPTGFIEDKDEAKNIRVRTILPSLDAGTSVVLDFSDVKSSTQSFIHALVGEALQRYRDSALEKLEFKNCSPQVKSLVQLVVDYSLGGFRRDAEAIDEGPRTREPKAKKKGR